MGKITNLKALSIKQPWIECILAKGKNIENRSWNTKYRGYFALHASGSGEASAFPRLAEDGIKIDRTAIPYGAIVGFAELVAVITEEEVTRKTEKWFSGTYGYVLANIIRLRKPVPVKGTLFFWDLKGRVLKTALDQLTPTQLKSINRRPLSR